MSENIEQEPWTIILIASHRTISSHAWTNNRIVWVWERQVDILVQIHSLTL